MLKRPEVEKLGVHTLSWMTSLFGPRIWPVAFNSISYEVLEELLSRLTLSLASLSLSLASSLEKLSESDLYY